CIPPQEIAGLLVAASKVAYRSIYGRSVAFLPFNPEQVIHRGLNLFERQLHESALAAVRANENAAARLRWIFAIADDEQAMCRASANGPTLIERFLDCGKVLVLKARFLLPWTNPVCLHIVLTQGIGGLPGWGGGLKGTVEF